MIEMTGKVGGQRPRPRVALIGDFEAEDITCFQRMFPTIWQAETFDKIVEQVDVREIDLIIIAPDIDYVSDWSRAAHVICFSSNIGSLPGPIQGSEIKIGSQAITEEFVFPDVPLPISRRRDADYDGLTSVRGWDSIQLNVFWNKLSKADHESANEVFVQGGIIFERHTDAVLTVAYLRKESSLGVAWFPNATPNKGAWVEILVTQWSQSDHDAFPNFGNWIELPEWLVAEEEKVLSQISALEKKKEDTVTKINQQIGDLYKTLGEIKVAVNDGLRRLITAQGDELVDEVEKALDTIGFKVTRVDDTLQEGQPKREDLRLNLKNGDDWEAILEVRGYARSAGTTADLQRLSRFAELYRGETGRYPDKRIYIVNGQLEYLPSQRQVPLAGAEEDVQVFSDSHGLIIWAVDLFKTLKCRPVDCTALIESIKQSVGRWYPPD